MSGIRANLIIFILLSAESCLKYDTHPRNNYFIYFCFSKNHVSNMKKNCTFFISLFFSLFNHFLDTDPVTGRLQVRIRHFLTFSSVADLPPVMPGPTPGLDMSLAAARRSRNRKQRSHRQASRPNFVNSMANS